MNPLLVSSHKYKPPKMYTVELSILLIIIVTIGVLVGVMTIITIPQVISDDLTSNKVYSLIIRGGSGILLIQNALILVFAFNFRGMQTFSKIELISFSIFHLDLLGFTLLGIGYLFYSTLTSETKKQYQQGGALLLGWVTCRIIVQYIIPYGLILHEYSEPLKYQTFAFYTIYRGFYEGYYDLSFPFEDDFGFDLPPLILILTFVMCGLLLYMASRTIPKKYHEKGITLFKVYGIINAVIIFTLPLIYYQEKNIIGLLTYNWLISYIPLFLKVIIIPILGLITFGFIFYETRIVQTVLL